MSFPRYPAYRPSHIEQLGDVPEHWQVVPVKRCLKSITQGWSPQCENYPAEAGQWGVLKVGCVNGGSFDPSENKALPSTLEPLPELSIRKGDVLVSRANTRDLVGGVAVAVVDFERLLLCDKLYRLRVDDERCDPTFLAHCLSTPASRGVIEVAATGASSSMLNIGQSAITGMFVAIPPLKEQRALVAFAAAEAAKIDVLVEEQRLLIELLKEKRQAVISHAVTKGLSPNVPMKDSGVTWFGEVPTHWKVGKARFYVSVLPGYAFSSTEFSFDDSDTKLLRGTNVGVGELRWDDVVYWARKPSDGLDTFELSAGDIVIGMDRPLIASGMRIARVLHRDLPCLLLQRVAKVQPGPLVEHRFIMRLLGSRAFEAHFAPETTGVSVPHISGEQICDFVVPIPPLDEQCRICDFLEVELAKLDALHREAECAMDLLVERRAALISAAVTGKIDVRGLAPQPQAANG